MYGMKPKIIRSFEPEPKNHVPSRKSAFWHLVVFTVQLTIYLLLRVQILTA